MGMTFGTFDGGYPCGDPLAFMLVVQVREAVQTPSILGSAWPQGTVPESTVLEMVVPELENLQPTPMQRSQDQTLREAGHLRYPPAGERIASTGEGQIWFSFWLEWREKLLLKHKIQVFR